MSSHKHLLRFSWILIAILAVWTLHPDITLAAPSPMMPTGAAADIADIVSKIISVLNIFIWVLFIFLNFVLDPNFIFDLSSGSFMGMLNTIWQLSRDLMNVVFALALVGAAIYTIITANKEFVSANAKKFIMAIILVNFSWFIPRVILDVSNVTAATIYGIPSLLFSASSCDYRSAENEGAFCSIETPADATLGTPDIYKCSCRVVTNAKFFLEHTQTQTLIALGWKCFGDTLCVQQAAWSPTITGHSAVLNGLILNHAHLQTMANVPGPVNSNDIGEMTGFLIREALILLIHVMMFFPLLAMFVAFLIRIPVLWLTIAFMPFYFMSMLISGNEMVGMTKKIGAEFIKAAFLPVMCAIPLCVGFILVNAGAQLAPANPMGYIQIRLIDSISSFFELFWWMMTIGVIWVGVFGALKMAGGLYAASAEKIKQFGESWGKVALKAPLAMPLIPGNAGSPTLLQLGKKFTPGQYNAALSQPGGLPQMIKDIKAGKTVGGATTPNSAGLNGGSHTDAQLLDIHKDLKDLQKEIAAAGGNKKLEQDAINKFQGSSSGQLSTLKIDISNPGKSVREYAAGLKASGNKATARVNDIETLSKTF